MCTAKGQPAGVKLDKGKNKHETPKLNSHSDRDCLHRAFATSPGSGPAARRGAIPTSLLQKGTNALQNSYQLAPQTQDLVGVRSFSAGDASFNTGVGAGALVLKHRRFQYRSRHCSTVAEYYRLTEHSRWK